MEMKEISSSSGMRGDWRYMMLFRRPNEMDRTTGESNDGERDGRESDGDVSTGGVSSTAGLDKTRSWRVPE